MYRNFWSANLLIKECNLRENLELSGTIKVPSHMATWLSPNGSVKKHSLYNKHPSACGESRKKTVKNTWTKLTMGKTPFICWHCIRLNWFCGWLQRTEICLSRWYRQLPLLGEGHFYYCQVWLSQTRTTTTTGDIWITELLWCGSACPDSYTLHQGFGMFCKHCSRKKIHVFIQPLHVANMLHFWICSTDACKAVIFFSPRTHVMLLISLA